MHSFHNVLCFTMIEHRYPPPPALQIHPVCQACPPAPIPSSGQALPNGINRLFRDLAAIGCDRAAIGQVFVAIGTGPSGLLPNTRSQSWPKSRSRSWPTWAQAFKIISFSLVLPASRNFPLTLLGVCSCSVARDTVFAMVQ